MAVPGGTYAACAVPEKNGAEAPKKVLGPIFLENPDGTITEAVPSNYKAPRPPRPGRRQSGQSGQSGVSTDSDGSSGGSVAVAANMFQEIDFLYTRHERIFLVLLGTQLFLEALYGVVFVVRMRPSVLELMAMYNWQIEDRAAQIILWAVFSLQATYALVYYLIAGMAMWTKRPKHYQMFAQWCLGGVVGLVLLAYIDKFNLPIFFLRLLAYIYSRFLQGLTASLLLLPPPVPA